MIKKNPIVYLLMHMTTVNVFDTLDYLHGIARLQHTVHRQSEKQVFT